MSEKFVIKSPLELELRDINEICILKDQHWPLGLKKQFGLWFVITNETDKLFLLEKNKKIISFLRLKLRQILVNNKIFDSFYLTEVCVDKSYQNQGWGKKIINESQNIIIKDKMNAYLLCNIDQKEFYSNLGWTYIKKIFTKEDSNTNIQKISNEKACLFYNLKYKSEEITLIGKIF